MVIKSMGQDPAGRSLAQKNGLPEDGILVLDFNLQI